MEMGWAAVVQALLVAFSTWYVRRGSTQDAKRVEQVTASQGTAHEILTRVKHLEEDMALVKRTVFKDNSVDHRGPKRGA
jgi:hypothetical protein